MNSSLNSEIIGIVLGLGKNSLELLRVNWDEFWGFCSKILLLFGDFEEESSFVFLSTRGGASTFGFEEILQLTFSLLEFELIEFLGTLKRSIIKSFNKIIFWNIFKSFDLIF